MIIKHFDNGVSVQEMLQSMQKSLLEWDKLLQLTGGALSLNKCKVSLMHWKQDFFGIHRCTSKTTGGTIQMPSEEIGDKMDSLDRIDPWKSERILCVRIPMDGSMKNEFEYRTKQIDSMAKKLHNAPFTPKDAEMVYQVRYKPTNKYAFPVILFDSNQLNDIQKKFVNNFLPKVGINRHMPRTVVYGPIALGGMGVMDLRMEQPVFAIKTIIGQMRRDNKAGKVLMANLYETQAEVGISRPFYNDGFVKYTHVTKNTRWYYIWQVCQEMKIELHVNKMWLPTPNTEKNRNLMEDALKDKYFTKRRNWKVGSGE